MQGKPMKLVSEFRLTYSMILNLLRVERLRVEDMMMRSFSEVDRHRKEKKLKSRLEELKKKRQNLTTLRSGCSGQTVELQAFYHIATEYLKIKEQNWNLLLNQQGVSKSLTSGRVILVNFKNEINIPCALLNVDQSSHEKTFSVLTLKNSVDLKPEHELSIEDYLALANPGWETFGLASSDHCVVNIKSSAVVDITKTVLKIDADKIQKDVERRQIPRFADAPLGASTLSCIENLQSYCTEQPNDDLFNWLKDFKIHDIELLTSLQKMNSLKAEIQPIGALKETDLKNAFAPIYEKQVNEDEIKILEWSLGEDSLANMEDYHTMIKVLQNLRYIDNNRTVQLKGRVACEMGSHELLVTELVFDNVLTERPPTEIAALLSCLVFQQRNCSAPGTYYFLNYQIVKNFQKHQKSARIGLGSVWARMGSE